MSQLAYVEVKNVIARTAHIKEAMRERGWKVTPRAASARRLPELAGEQPPTRPPAASEAPPNHSLAAAGGRSTANGSVTSSC